MRSHAADSESEQPVQSFQQPLNDTATSGTLRNPNWFDFVRASTKPATPKLRGASASSHWKVNLIPCDSQNGRFFKNATNSSYAWHYNLNTKREERRTYTKCESPATTSSSLDRRTRDAIGHRRLDFLALVYDSSNKRHAR